MNVAIVVDPRYSGLKNLIEQMPVWAIDCAHHRIVAEDWGQSHGSADAFHGITLFKVANEKDAEANCLGIVQQVDLHHGIYSSGSMIEMLKVVGTNLSDTARKVLGEYEFVDFEAVSDGFIARVSSNQK